MALLTMALLGVMTVGVGATETSVEVNVDQISTVTSPADVTTLKITGTTNLKTELNQSTFASFTALETFMNLTAVLLIISGISLL